MQAVAPGEAAYEPAGQSSQAEPSALAYVPSVQGVHASLPSSSAVEPAGHLAQVEAPASLWYQVAGQAEQYGCQLVRRPSESTALPGAPAPL